MQRANEDSFLEELSPLSEALVTVNALRASIARTGFYITIGLRNALNLLFLSFLKELEILDYQGP